MVRSLTLPRLGMGAAQIGNLYRETSDEEAEAAVAAAWDSGVRYFDTAPHYGLGLSERRLGSTLRGRRRDEYIISTKVGRLLVPTPERARAGLVDDEGFAVPAEFGRQWDFSRDGILRSVEQSLIRLGLDRLDVVFLHDPDEHWHAASTTGMAALVELRDQGVVTAIGAGMNQSAMLTRFVHECDVDIVMLAGRYTLLDRSADSDLLPAALDRGVAVVAAGVYNSGLLSRATVMADSTFDYQPAPAYLVDRARALADACDRFGVELPEAALQFPLRHPAVSTVVVGVRTDSQARVTADRAGREIPQALWSEPEIAA